MKIKSGYGKNSSNHDSNSTNKWKQNTPTKSSTINSKHKQKAYISPYSRTLPTYNAATSQSTGFWQQPPPGYWPLPVTSSLAVAPPLPPMPSDIEAPPPPSTTPPPLQPDEKLAGLQRKDQGKHCNSISKKLSSPSSSSSASVYSSTPAILNNYVNINNIPRSQTHLKYNHPMTNSGGSTNNSLSESNLLLKTVGNYGIGGGGGFMNGYLVDGEAGGGAGGTSYERGECFSRFVLFKV